MTNPISTSLEHLSSEDRKKALIAIGEGLIRLFHAKQQKDRQTATVTQNKQKTEAELTTLRRELDSLYNY